MFRVWFSMFCKHCIKCSQWMDFFVLLQQIWSPVSEPIAKIGCWQHRESISNQPQNWCGLIAVLIWMLSTRIVWYKDWPLPSFFSNILYSIEDAYKATLLILGHRRITNLQFCSGVHQTGDHIISLTFSYPWEIWWINPWGSMGSVCWDALQL